MRSVFRSSIIPLITSLVFGTLWAVIGEFLYNALDGVIYRPLLVALYLTGLALFLFLSAIISNAWGKNAKPSSSAYVKSLILIAVILLFGLLFEFLYELDPGKESVSKPTSYIFLIDDSGSMSSNDPDDIRDEAIPEVMEKCKKDFPFAVYSFANECEIITPFTPASDAEEYHFTSDGGLTYLADAMDKVLDDLEDGTLGDAGKAPRLLLLSDGIPSDILSHSDYRSSSEYESILQRCRDLNLSISTVGLGDNVSEDLLTDLADDTDGVYIWAEDASDLTDAIDTAVSSHLDDSRSLIGYRNETDNEVLYAILHIVFMLILAAAFVFIKIFMFSTFDEKNIALITFIVLGVIGAVGLEIGANVIECNPLYPRAVMCIFFTLLFGSAIEAQNSNGFTQSLGNTRSFRY